MAADVLFLDVETPNGHNDRISSIGLIRCDCNGAVLAEDSYLGGPAFAPFCWGCLSFSALTGQSSVAHSS